MSLQVHEWSRLDEAARARLLERPAMREAATLESTVAEIVADVRRRGDAALYDYTERFDGLRPAGLAVDEDEIAAAEAALSASALDAIDAAIANVRRFHEAQRPVPLRVETTPGVVCERIARPIDAVGLYVPAGSAPLPSAAIMLAVPAVIAACPEIALCTPPRRDGRADPSVVTAAVRGGVRRIYKIGGAQAVAALAYGTETVPKVNKIFGPGNAWVTAAKSLVAADPAGAAADLPAGPSEVLVVADDSADAEFVAADLLAQAEHGRDSQVLLVTPSRRLAGAVGRAVERQNLELSRRAISEAALAHSTIVLVDGIETALEVSNAYAPEHLILQLTEPRRWLERVRNAGSVFLGPWTPETVGDYCSGTNHVLPTYGYARAHAGLGVDQFLRQMTVQELSYAGLEAIGPVAVELAGLEGLDAHANAVTLRLGERRRRTVA